MLRRPTDDRIRSRVVHGYISYPFTDPEVTPLMI